MKKITLCLALAAAATAPALAAGRDYSSVLQQARADVPLAHPLATNDLPPPPFSLLSERPVKPAYVPTLPGLRSGAPAADDFGRKAPKFDAVFIRKSRVENGVVVIPPGGLAYMEDTWGGEVALRGEQVPVLGKTSTYVDYDMSIVVKENVTIPAGQSVVVGGQVYHYYATVGHGQTANHTLHVRTIAGTDWEWAFGAPVLSKTQSQWWGGAKFAQLYNQGQASEVTREKMVFDWISGVRMDRMVLADEKVFAGTAAAGDSWKAGTRTVRVAAVNVAAGTVTVEVLEGDKAVFTKTLGPVNKQLLIEDTASRKALVFEYGDIIGFLSPWPEPFQDGKANLKVYAQAYSLAYGSDYAADKRFAVYPVGCPTGHNFGFMLVNKEEIRIKPGALVDGPQAYFKIAVDRIDGDQVLAWHVEDGKGNKSHNLGGAGIANIDLVLGQGRVAGEAILKDVGKALLERSYAAAAAPTAAKAEGPLTPALAGGMGVSALGLFALAFELGRRRPKAA
jgi:hypothetical protein